MTTYGDLLLDVVAGVATVTINRPAKRNAMTVAMWESLERVCLDIARMPDVSAVVVTGEGPTFCAGADITALSADDALVKRVVRQAESALRELAVPTVAAIRGNCMGGGVQIAVACDIRVAASDAVFAVPPAKLGVIYPVSSIRTMVALIGPAASKRLVYTAAPIGATEAFRLGLVDEVVAPDGLDAAVAELVASFGEKSVLSQSAAKAMVNAVVSGADTEAEYARWNAIWSTSVDSTEGPAAFLAKRPAEFGWHPSELA